MKVFKTALVLFAITGVLSVPVFADGPRAGEHRDASDTDCPAQTDSTTGRARDDAGETRRERNDAGAATGGDAPAETPRR